MPPREHESPCYAAPDGWQCLFRVSTDQKQVKTSTRDTRVIDGICNTIWKKYAETRPNKRQLKELCLAVNPRWLKAALASAEVAAQRHIVQPMYAPDVRLGGMRVREDAAVPTNAIHVEEKTD